MSQNDTEQTSGVQSVVAVFLSVLKHCDLENIRNKQAALQKTHTHFTCVLISAERHAKRYPNVNQGIASRGYDVT